MTAVAITISALNFLSAGAAVGAAFFWYRAATIQIEYDPSKDNGSAGIIVESGNKKYDYFATGSARDGASRTGALFASVAALMQGLALVVGGLTT